MASILLAEDDSSMREFLKIALERANHKVDIAENGLKALDMAKANKSYDLLLTDIVMPGIDGIELAQRVAEASPKIKIMFITGFAGVAMDRQERQTENTPVLSKPFHLNDLVKQVDTLLEAA